MKHLTLTLLALSLFGCATLKKTNTETEIKTDSTAVKETKKEEIETNKRETVSDYKANTLSYEPIDIKIPYYVDGKEYRNVKVVNKNETELKKVTEEQQKIINTLINELNQLKDVLKQEKQEKEKDYTKVIESVSNKLFWLVLALFVISKLLNYFKPKIL